jgi:methylated-DNA-[protein]-cysteine S-methyltransferase
VEGVAYLDSPVGVLLIRSQNDFITTVHFHKSEKGDEQLTPVIEQCIAELNEYFQGTRKFFTIPLALEGSAFQKKVWDVLLEIPYGKTISYSRQAVQVGDIKSIRAVAMTNGQNPIVIIIPCHRVIGKDGSLVGYGGGLDTKTWLLKHEGAISDQLQLF